MGRDRTVPGRTHWLAIGMLFGGLQIHTRRQPRSRLGYTLLAGAVWTPRCCSPCGSRSNTYRPRETTSPRRSGPTPSWCTWSRPARCSTRCWTLPALAVVARARHPRVGRQHLERRLLGCDAGHRRGRHAGPGHQAHHRLRDPGPDHRCRRRLPGLVRLAHAARAPGAEPPHATEVAQWLQRRPQVGRVFYPALADDPGHALWQRDFSGASGQAVAV